MKVMKSVGGENPILTAPRARAKLRVRVLAIAMDRRRRQKMLDISRQFTHDIEAVLQDSAEPGQF